MVSADYLPGFNVVLDVEDLEHAGKVLDMFVAFGNFENITRLAVVDGGMGGIVRFGLEWRFSWDSDGVESAHVKIVGETGDLSANVSWDRKTVAGIFSADDACAMIRCDRNGFPELKIMYCPDLIKREKIMSRVIEGVARFDNKRLDALAEAESGN